MSAQTVQLGECVQVINGFAFKSNLFTTERQGLPIVRIRDVIRGRSETYYTGDYPNSAIVQNGDLLIGMDGEFNIARWQGGRALLNQRVCKLEALSNKSDISYLRYALRVVLKRIEDRTPYVTVKHLSSEELKEEPIPLPELSEQKRIAGLLEQADRLRRTRRYALELSDTFLPAAFLELFGDLQSGSGKKVGLSTVANMLTGYPFKSEEYTDAGETIKLCRGANVLPDRIDWSDLALWPKSKSHDLSEYLLQAGDVVIAMDRPWISEGFKIAQIRPEHCPTFLVQRVTRLRGKNSVPNAFLYHLLRHPAFTRHCRPTETTIPHISPTEIKTFSFCVPPLALQQQFAALVERHEHLRATQREALRQAEHLFQSLLHRAFNQES